MKTAGYQLPLPPHSTFLPREDFLNITKSLKNILQHNHNSKQWKIKKKKLFLWNQVYIKAFETILESTERNSQSENCQIQIQGDHSTSSLWMNSTMSKDYSNNFLCKETFQILVQKMKCKVINPCNTSEVESDYNLLLPVHRSVGKRSASEPGRDP